MLAGADLAHDDSLTLQTAREMWKFSTLATCILLAVCLCARVLAQPVAHDLVAQRSAHLAHFREKPLYFYRSLSPSASFMQQK